MLILPIKNNAGRDALIVVLGAQNIERMKRADPMQLESLGKVLHNPKVMICYEEQTPEFNRLVQAGDLGKLIEYLTRGFEFRPDLGDHDNGPQSVHTTN